MIHLSRYTAESQALGEMQACTRACRRTALNAKQKNGLGRFRCIETGTLLSSCSMPDLRLRGCWHSSAFRFTDRALTVLDLNFGLRVGFGTQMIPTNIVPNSTNPKWRGDA